MNPGVLPPSSPPVCIAVHFLLTYGHWVYDKPLFALDAKTGNDIIALCTMLAPPVARLLADIRDEVRIKRGGGFS